MAVWRSALVWALLLSTVPWAKAKAKKRKAAKASAGTVSWQVLWNGDGADAAMQQLAAVDGLAKRGDTQGAQALLARISAREFGDYDEGAAASMLVARAATHSDFGEQQRLLLEASRAAPLSPRAHIELGNNLCRRFSAEPDRASAAAQAMKSDCIGNYSLALERAASLPADHLLPGDKQQLVDFVAKMFGEAAEGVQEPLQALQAFAVMRAHGHAAHADHLERGLYKRKTATWHFPMMSVTAPTPPAPTAL
jgi:hypothetical protein